MSNIIKAFINIANNPIIELVDYYSGKNRINNAGKALEIYIQDAFADTINESNELKRLEKLEQIYSYQGNQNNPPDRIDPLGITDLRIREMWHIANPNKIKVLDIRIKSPNNPVKLVEAKLLVLKYRY